MTRREIFYSFLVKNRDFLVELIFPKICVGCGENGFWLCEKCSAKIKIIKTDLCIFCGKIRDKGKLCGRCRSRYVLTGVIVATKFQGVMKKAIHSLKYDGNQDLAVILSKILEKKLETTRISKDFIITSVPLHWRKGNFRGFNQSELLAKLLAKKTGRPYRRLLKRIKPTESQTALGGVSRRENLKGAFKPLVEKIENKRIILVDDVCTTGSTLNECAIQLRKVGAREVWGLVLAHGN